MVIDINWDIKSKAILDGFANGYDARILFEKIWGD